MVRTIPGSRVKARVRARVLATWNQLLGEWSQGTWVSGHY